MHSFDTTIRRVGFACKWAAIGKRGLVESVDGFNTGTTTYAWAKRQATRDIVLNRIMDIAKSNVMNTHALVKKIASLPHRSLRMLRLTSDILPFYTLDEYSDFWHSSEIQNTLARWFAPIGETARAGDIRLSFHPGQFTVLASDNPEIVNKSIEEFEYHTDMARWMGYGVKFQDFKINVHIAGRLGPAGLRRAYGRLSPEARNTITIENEEISHDLDTVLQISDICPIVLDVHHHWVNCGEYIQASDPRISRVIDSWRGVRPVIHYSISREDLLTSHNTSKLPDLHALITEGYNKQKLRAHSDYMWNTAANDWVYTLWALADVMVESKAKNLASFKLYEYYRNKGQ